MSKVTLNHMFVSASGKLCKKEGTYVAYNKQTGKMYTAEYHGRETVHTDVLDAVRTTFTTKAKLASVWWNANKPTKENTLGTEAYQKVIKAYKSQKNIGNPYSYLRSLVTDDLKVMLGTTDITNGASAGTSGSGSSSSQSGGSSSQGGGSDTDLEG